MQGLVINDLTSPSHPLSPTRICFPPTNISCRWVSLLLGIARTHVPDYFMLSALCYTENKWNGISVAFGITVTQRLRLAESRIGMSRILIVYWVQIRVPKSKSWECASVTAQEAHQSQNLSQKHRLLSLALCWECSASTNELNSDTGTSTYQTAPIFYDLLWHSCAEAPCNCCTAITLHFQVLSSLQQKIDNHQLKSAWRGGTAVCFLKEGSEKVLNTSAL